MGSSYRNYHRPSSISTSPSILDSPTLARVERARRRQENEENGTMSQTLSSYCPSLISVDTGREMHAIKKGLMWQQRERLFARWKERYFILTRDYLHCFKRSSGSEMISNMGQFIFKVKLVEVDKVEWINKKSYSTVGLVLQDRDYKILLRTNDGLEDWFELLEECTMTSKERRKALHKFGVNGYSDTNCQLLSSASQKITNNNIDNWLLSRANPTTSLSMDQSSLSDSVPDLQTQLDDKYRNDQRWKRTSNSYQQRLSLLTDIDITNCTNSVGMSSVQSSIRGTPYRLNSDVFFMASDRIHNNGNDKLYNNNSMYNHEPPLSSLGSFRNNQFPVRTPQDKYCSTASPLPIKYRDRSQSDAFNCKTRSSSVANRRSYISQATHV